MSAQRGGYDEGRDQKREERGRQMITRGEKEEGDEGTGGGQGGTRRSQRDRRRP